MNWHVKIEELRLQELKLNRELVKGKEEIKYLNNIISEYEQTINSLEEEIVQQSKVSFSLYFCSFVKATNIRSLHLNCITVMKYSSPYIEYRITRFFLLKLQTCKLT